MSLLFLLVPVFSAPTLDLTSPLDGVAYDDNDVSFVYAVNSSFDYVDVIIEYDGHNSTSEPIETNLTRHRVFPNLNMGEHTLIFYIEEDDVLYSSAPVSFVVLDPLSRCGKWNNSFGFSEPHLPEIAYYNQEYSFDIRYASPDVGCHVTVYSPLCEVVDFWVPRRGQKLATEYIDEQLYTGDDGRLHHKFMVRPEDYPLSTGNVYTVLISCEGENYVQEFGVTDNPKRGMLTSLGRVYQNAEDYAVIFIFICSPILLLLWYFVSFEAMVYMGFIMISAMIADSTGQYLIYAVTAFITYMALRKEVFIPKGK